MCLTLTGGHPKYHSTPADYTVYSFPPPLSLSLSHSHTRIWFGGATSARQVTRSEINHHSFVAPLLSQQEAGPRWHTHTYAHTQIHRHIHTHKEWQADSWPVTACHYKAVSLTANSSWLCWRHTAEVRSSRCTVHSITVWLDRLF